MTRNVIPFCAYDATVLPATSQTQIVGRLSADMKDAEVLV